MEDMDLILNPARRKIAFNPTSADMPRARVESLLSF